MKYIHIIICFILSLSLLGCGKGADKQKRSKIVVIHSFPETGEEAAPFREYMDEQMENNGVDADVRHIYLNFIHKTTEDNEDSASVIDPLLIADMEVWYEYIDTLLSTAPEVILVNDDPALMWLLKCAENEELSEGFNKVFSKTPVVFAGINILDKEKLANHKNFTGFIAPINVQNVCKMYSTIYKKDTAFVTIGFSEYDTMLRKHLKEQLADSTQFAVIERIGGRDSVILAGSGKEGVFTIIFNSEGDEDIQVKRRLVGDATHNSNDEPMLSCVRERFCDGENQILGGYFSSLETEVDDEVRYAAQILKGSPVSSLPIMQHRSHYYLDWKILKESPLKNKSYKEFPSRIEIVNVPFYIKHAAECVWIIIGLCLVVTILTYLITLPFRRVRKQKAQQEVERLKREMRLKQLIFTETNAVPWHSKQGVVEFPKEFADKNNYPYRVRVEDFLKCFHPDYLKDIMQIRNLRDNIGRHKARVKLNIHYDDPACKDDWHFWDVIANVTPESAATGELSGVVINADEEEKSRHALEDAIYSAKEIELKEQFLLNISQQLKEPLEHILENADIIMGDKPTSAEEIAEANEKLHSGTDSLLKMIDSVMKGEN